MGREKQKGSAGRMEMCHEITHVGVGNCCCFAQLHSSFTIRIWPCHSVGLMCPGLTNIVCLDLTWRASCVLISSDWNLQSFVCVPHDFKERSMRANQSIASYRSHYQSMQLTNYWEISRARRNARLIAISVLQFLLVMYLASTTNNDYSQRFTTNLPGFSLAGLPVRINGTKSRLLLYYVTRHEWLVKFGVIKWYHN